MAGLHTLRAAAVLAIIAVVSVVWVVHRTVQRSQASNERVVHTQEVLTAIESVLATIVDADTAVRSDVSSADARNLTALGQTARTVDAKVSHLAALTADNPNQRARVTQLRQDAAGVLAALGARVEATQAPRSVNPTDAEAQRTRIDSARRTLQAMRTEENRLLADRVTGGSGGGAPSSVLLDGPRGGSLRIPCLDLLAHRAQRPSPTAGEQTRSGRQTRTWKRKWTRAQRISVTRMRACNRSSIRPSTASSSSTPADGSRRSTQGPSGCSATRAPEVIGRNVKHADAVALSRGARRLPRAYLTHGRCQDHRDRPRGHRTPTRRHAPSRCICRSARCRSAASASSPACSTISPSACSSRSELRASEARWRSIIDSAVDGIVVIDAHGRIEAFNPAAERLFGYAEHEVVGRNVNMLMPSPYHEEHDAYLARYLATGRAEDHRHRPRGHRPAPDGTTFPLHLSVGEMTVGGERQVHRHPARPERARADRGATARADVAGQARRDGRRDRPRSEEPAGRHPRRDSGHRRRGFRRAARTPRSSKEIVARIDALNELMKDLLLFARPPQPKPAPVDMARAGGRRRRTCCAAIRRSRTMRGARLTGSAPRDRGGCRAPQDRLPEPAGQQRARDAGTRHDPRVADRRSTTSARSRSATSGPGIPRGGSREDLHAVLHDQSARIGSGACPPPNASSRRTTARSASRVR